MMKKIVAVLIAILASVSIAMPVMAAINYFEPKGADVDLSTFESKGSDIDLSAFESKGSDIDLSAFESKGTDIDLSAFELENANVDSVYVSKTQLSDLTSETDFYSAFMRYIEDVEKPINDKIYIDTSGSMTKTFSYETSKIMENLQPYFDKNGIEYENVFEENETSLNTIINNYVFEYNQEGYKALFPLDTLMVVTDLWDTKAVEFDFNNQTANMVFFVPYKSTNSAEVMHCQSFVNNILCKHEMCYSTIAIVYMNNVVVEYSKLSANVMKVEIIVP